MSYCRYKEGKAYVGYALYNIMRLNSFPEQQRVVCQFIQLLPYEKSFPYITFKIMITK